MIDCRPTFALAAALVLAQTLTAAAETVEVTASALNVRTGPGTGFSRLGLTRRGQRHEVLARSSRWVKVRWNGREGWSHGSYLRVIAAAPATQLAVTAGALNVRTGPSTRYRVLGKLTRGTRVNVVGSSGRWRKIAYGARTAWVHGAYLTSSAVPPVSASAPSAWDRTPPGADYRRTTFRGVKVNGRTVELVKRAERIIAGLGHSGFQFVFTQGSYNTSVSASAGTHAGGGALDIRTRGKARSTVDNMVRALRQAGFAAWSRGRGHDPFAPHIHAIAIGDGEASTSARSQIGSYGRGLNGLRNQARDPDSQLGRGPQWAQTFLR